MKAAWYSRSGAASDVLQVGDLPDPVPAAGEVRVKLVTSGVNPSDVKARLGRTPPSPHVVPHSDGAGVIDQVGAGVSTERIGQRVWLWNAQWDRAMGTACEYVALPEQQAVVLPEGVDFETAACFGIPGMTAMHAIQRTGELADQTVLVTGAGNAVGHYVTQLARARGARVIGTVGSPARAANALGAGANELVNYKTENVPERILALTHGQGVDAIIDMDFASTSRWLNQGILKPHGRYVCYGSSDTSQLSVDYRSVLWRCTELYFFLVYALSPQDRARAIEEWTVLQQQGAIKTTVSAVYGLDGVVRAHEAVESGAAVGNVILRL